MRLLSITTFPAAQVFRRILLGPKNDFTALGRVNPARMRIGKRPTLVGPLALYTDQGFSP